MALVSWSLADGFLPDRYPGWAAVTYWATAVSAALLMFASLLVHELAHSLVARARGLSVEGITLFLLGAVSNLRTEPGRAKDEFLVSIVGPLASLALAAGFGLGALAFGAGGRPADATLWYLALGNLLLAGFNLLPAYPLDGGRMLRSVVWAVTGSVSTATRLATRGSQTIGVAMIALGVFAVFAGYILGGLWLAFVGWFLLTAATGGQRETELKTGSKASGSEI